MQQILVYESRAAYCKPFFLCWQGYRANNMGTGTLSGFNNPLGRLVENTMVVGLYKGECIFCFVIFFIPIE